MRLAIALLALASCDRSSSVARSDSVPEARTGAPVVDDATVPSCTIAYSCGLSHPRLGSSSRTTSIDFSTCSKTTASESGPFEAAPLPVADASNRSSTSATSKLSSAECARVRAALTAVTQADARAAQESAQIDTEACGLTVQCKGDPAPKLQVQRQTTSGPSRVERLIRAVLGMTP